MMYGHKTVICKFKAHEVYQKIFQKIYLNILNLRDYYVEYIKEAFIVLLSFSGSLATKFISFINEPFLARPTLLDLNPDELSQGPCRYAIMISLGKRGESCNNLDDLSSRTCVSNKTEEINLNVFNIITGLNESKTKTFRNIFFVTLMQV